MSGHTPGPWAVELDTIRNGDIDVRSGLVDVAQVCVRRRPDQVEIVPRETGLANARLIAAAPELLEALRALREAAEEVYKAGRIDALAFVVAGNAIAKAEGR